MADTKQAGARSYTDFDPDSDWASKEDAETLRLYLPGFKKEQIRVLVDSSGHLRATGERPLDGARWIRFRKDFRVPTSCDVDAIRAKFEGQVLEVTLPKRNVSKKPPVAPKTTGSITETAPPPAVSAPPPAVSAPPVPAPEAPRAKDSAAPRAAAPEKEQQQIKGGFEGYNVKDKTKDQEPIRSAPAAAASAAEELKKMAEKRDEEAARPDVAGGGGGVAAADAGKIKEEGTDMALLARRRVQKRRAAAAAALIVFLMALLGLGFYVVVKMRSCDCSGRAEARQLG